MHCGKTLIPPLVKHDAVARTGHLFSAETCSFFVETRAFSVDEHFPCELKKARPPEYLLVLYDGGEEEKIKSQVNIATSWSRRHIIKFRN